MCRCLVKGGLVFLVGLLFWVASASAQKKLDLRLLEVDLPGPPVQVFTSDLDADGVGDLLVLVAYTTWDQVIINEEVEMDEVEGLIEMMTVVPALADRRELFFFRGSREGGFVSVGGGLDVPSGVHAFLPGPPGAPVLAVDDVGLLAVRLTVRDLEEGGPQGSSGELTIAYQRLVDQPTILSGSGTLLPGLSLTADIDQDGLLDLLYPLPGEFAVYLGSDPGFSDPEYRAPGFSSSSSNDVGSGRPGPRLSSVDSVYLPGREELQVATRGLHYPLPRLEDLNGDGLPELILTHPDRGIADPWIAINRGGGQFAPLRRPLQEYQKGAGEEDGSIVFLGDMDGDGQAEFLHQKLVEAEDAGFRDEMRAAKRPSFHNRVFQTSPAFELLGDPRTFESKGYAFGEESDDEFRLPGGFHDLDGDGRLDLVTITLDFSLMQLVRVMVTQSISIGLDFHIYCQQPDGQMRKVEGLDLSGKFKVRLNDLRLGQLSQFAGDFDGDGRADFVQMGRGREASIHRGASGCRYPARPDLRIKLKAAPKDLSLVHVRDYDGDGLSDLLVVHPRKGRGKVKADAEDASTLPVTLEMHLSRGMRSGGAVR